MDLLVSVVISLGILYIVYLLASMLVDALAAPEGKPKAQQVIKIVFLILALLTLCRVVGWVGGPPFYYWHR